MCAPGIPERMTGQALFGDRVMSLSAMKHISIWRRDRNALLGISNSIMLAEVTANRVLEQIDPPEFLSDQKIAASLHSTAPTGTGWTHLSDRSTAEFSER